MKGNLTLQLVPHLPPALSGVGDYATLLHQELNRRGAGEGREFRLLACGWQEQPQLLDPTSINLSGPRRQGRLLETLLSLPVNGLYLHYVGYGYAPRGAPTWLLHALRSYRRERPSVRLGVMFHELYATGLPWQSSFWLSPRQRKIAAELSRLADFWVTNREQSARWLLSRTCARGYAQPIFSTIGEGKKEEDRRNGIAIFGSPGLRESTYAAAGNTLFPFAGREGLQVHDLGAPLSSRDLRARLKAEGVIEHGALPPVEISAILSRCLYGIVCYPVQYLTKSSVFAAYAAHGLCPVVFANNHPESDGLRVYQHYLPGLPSASPPVDPFGIATTVRSWYAGHSLEAQIERIARNLQSTDSLATMTPCS